MSSKVFIESLDNRLLCSATVQAGKLVIVGTKAAENITVIVAPGDSSKIRVTQGRTVKTFSRSAVHSISVRGATRDDKVTISDANGKLGVPFAVHGGAKVNRLTATGSVSSDTAAPTGGNSAGLRYSVGLVGHASGIPDDPEAYDAYLRMQDNLSNPGANTRGCPPSGTGADGPSVRPG